jgi:predicted nucleic-acid-binding protein
VLGIDTNILVRLLIADDAVQTRKARALIDQCIGRDEPVLVSLLVAIETEWVLRSRYEIDKSEILAVFRSLLAVRELSFEDEAAFEEALFYWQDAPIGFVDCLIAAHNRRLGCNATATFDTKASRLPGFVGA